MPNRSTDALFQLIHSLEKSEKRNFKLYVTRNSSGEDLKVVQLFDAMDKMEEYDEALILKKNKDLKKQQLSNIKAHLYKQILSSLRLIKDDENIDIQLREQMDHARILYNKGLYLQSLKVLDRMKELAREYNQFTYLLQVLFFEKKIEALHITRSMQDRADRLTTEVEEVNKRLDITSKLSNLALQLYSWYIRNGHARNEKDEVSVTNFFEKHFPKEAEDAKGFYERLYRYQCYCWYGFIRQDLLTYYRYTQKWVDLFSKEKHMVEVETAHYIKGLHNLLTAHLDLQNFQKFNEVLDTFEQFSQSKIVLHNHNNNIQTFVYLNLQRINKYFMEGTFTEGCKMVPVIEEKLTEYTLYLDRHRILVFYYKFASLYFGSGQYEKAIDYLNKIINWKVDLRTDLQAYSRLLHLIAHYELKNFDLLEYLFKSVYRFMSKMENLSVVEEEIFRFLRRSFHITPRNLKTEFEKLLNKLKQHQRNRYETRAFMYLDIISWLESKIDNVPVQEVIRHKFLQQSKRKAVEE
ncbi:hypothetical protein HHL16_08455 [Pseudoflavitalea sp. G-6-1-2]|nr:hypothetical protein [Pseudoflavitalea sp. G-6-1-2]NML20902.1 hypothetical protein [Pseudoflavitalea sp. G-6-1-2]